MTKKSLPNGDLRRQMDAELMAGIKKIASIETKLDNLISGCVPCKKDVEGLKSFRSKVYGWAWSGSAMVALIVSWLRGK